MSRSKRLESVCAGAVLGLGTLATGQPVQHNEQGAPWPELWWLNLRPHPAWEIEPPPLPDRGVAAPQVGFGSSPATPAPATWMLPAVVLGVTGRRRRQS